MLLSGAAQAKCTIRVGDPLITARYQECNRRTFLSYLYNDLVTPYSFTCAKKLSETCQKEGCSNPTSEDDTQRCMGAYVAVLNECNQQIEDAAKMARCKDTKAWPVETVAIHRQPAPPPAAARERAPAVESLPVMGPEFPVRVEPLGESQAMVTRKKARKNARYGH